VRNAIEEPGERENLVSCIATHEAEESRPAAQVPEKTAANGVTSKDAKEQPNRPQKEVEPGFIAQTVLVESRYSNYLQHKRRELEYAEGEPWDIGQLDYVLEKLHEDQCRNEQRHQLSAAAAHAFLEHFQLIAARPLIEAGKTLPGLIDLIRNNDGLFLESEALYKIIEALRVIAELREALRRDELHGLRHSSGVRW